jgi:hypothetical protein
MVIAVTARIQNIAKQYPQKISGWNIDAGEK